jgi:hypothetical protein
MTEALARLYGMDATWNQAMYPCKATTDWELIRTYAMYKLSNLSNVRVIYLALLHPSLDDYTIAQLTVSSCIPISVWFDHKALVAFATRYRERNRSKDFLLSNIPLSISWSFKPDLPSEAPNWQGPCYQWVTAICILLGTSIQSYSFLLSGYVESRLIQEYSAGRWPAVLALGPSSPFIKYASGLVGTTYLHEGQLGKDLCMLLGHIPGSDGSPARFLFPSNKMWALAGRQLLGAWAKDNEAWFASCVTEVKEGCVEGLTAAQWVSILEVGPVRHQQFAAVAASLVATAEGQQLLPMLHSLGIRRVTSGIELDHLARAR